MEDNRDSSEAEQGQHASTPSEQSDAGPRSSRLWIRPVFFVLYGLVVVTATPLIILDIIHGAQGDESLVIILAGPAFFAMVASLAISAWGIINHIQCFTRPAMQKYIIRILLMIPIFELTSWFALRFPDSGIYLESIRQLYQAVLVYNYVVYLVAFFEEVPNFDNRLAMKPQIRVPRPFCWKKATPNKRLIQKCKYGMFSYKIIRIVFTIISLTAFQTKTFLQGWFSPDGAYLWVTIFLTIAQICAMFCLSLLRKVTREELQMLPKSSSQFVGVHLALFFDHFQTMFLRLLANSGAIKSSYPGFVGDKQEFATMLENFLLCFEMVLVALLFNYAFDYRRYKVEGQPRLSFAQSLKQIWGVSDVASNIIGRFRQRGDHTSRDDNQQQTTAGSPASQQNGAPPKEEAEPPRRRKAGHQFISMPDIIINHTEDFDHAAEIHSPRNQDGGDQNHDGGEPRPNQDGEPNQVHGIENPGFQGESRQEHSKPTEEDGLGDDASEDTDDFLDEEFPTDDEDDSDIDNGLPFDGRLDAPRGAKPQGRRVKKVSYAGMTFDDLDPSKLGHPSHDSPAVAKKKRVKKVSYAGMTFEDMDWEQIRSHQSSTLDSETAHTVASIVEQSEEQYPEGKEVKRKGKPDGDGFGSSEA
ncbi:transmembrane protein 184C-like [Patiria miniata]|uniref:Uncharacterized protein n=1 Tax=Patiria miniata TaxID=46514 RepID=A0A913ZVZ4_PATMI|nr:transmembrane protein 184C-like [Patiria miniata]